MTADSLNLFVLGATYGMTVCSMACLPYLGPFLMGTGTGFRDGCYSVISFFSGKIVSYTILGGLAAYLGKSLPAAPLNNHIMAGIILFSALTIPFVSAEKCSSLLKKTGKQLSLFAMGSISGLVPCPPLVAVLILAATQENILSGGACGLAFGTGLAISPALPLGGVLSFISARVKEQAVSIAPFMRYSCMLIMIIASIRMVT